MYSPNGENMVSDLQIYDTIVILQRLGLVIDTIIADKGVHGASVTVVKRKKGTIPKEPHTLSLKHFR